MTTEEPNLNVEQKEPAAVDASVGAGCCGYRPDGENEGALREAQEPGPARETSDPDDADAATTGPCSSPTGFAESMNRRFPTGGSGPSAATADTCSSSACRAPGLQRRTNRRRQPSPLWLVRDRTDRRPSDEATRNRDSSSRQRSLLASRPCGPAKAANPNSGRRGSNDTAAIGTYMRTRCEQWPVHTRPPAGHPRRQNLFVCAVSRPP
jgi:hypothetical protein